MWRNRYVFMDAAGDAGSTGATAGTAGTATAATGANAANSGAANSGGSTGGSVMAAGATSDGSGTSTADRIPEKYRVNKEDGTFDLDASALKLSEAYANAEKRIGTGDLPPKTAEEYAVTVPEAFKEVWTPEEDASFKDFRTKAFEAGMTQKQLDLVMGQYFTMAPNLVAGATMLDEGAAIADLKKTWATEADFKRNVGNSYAGAKAIGEKAGIPIDTIMDPVKGLGNNPMFIRLMAAIGPEFAEDKAPGGGQVMTQESIDTLMRSEAYTNPKHADYAKTSEKVRKYWERKAGTEAAA